jgi:hypothetical protein
MESIAMAYEAVYEYADEDSSTYDEYQLTYDAVLDGDEEIETEIATYTNTTCDEWNQVSTEDVQMVMAMVSDVRSIRLNVL